nr:Uncharacterised protein [Klebsiella pneumoniae]
MGEFTELRELLERAVIDARRCWSATAGHRSVL